MFFRSCPWFDSSSLFVKTLILQNNAEQTICDFVPSTAETYFSTNHSCTKFIHSYRL